MREITPMASMQRRMPEHGRIRIGEKTAKAMKAIDTFRFTSGDRKAIEAIAMLYGGELSAFEDGKVKGQWQVKTESKEINVVLPPDPLQGTPVYELWSGGGCQRRCNGEVCEVPVKTPEGATTMAQDCICSSNDKLECKPITRLNVILPEIRFGGSWRLETKGWNAAHELPGMVEMVLSLQEQGMIRALLALEPRTSVSGGQTKKFVVPVIRLADTPNDLAAGLTSMGALPVGAPALESGPPVDPEPELNHPLIQLDEDDFIEAEIVEDDEVAKKLRQRIAIRCNELWPIDADEVRHGLAEKVSRGRTQSTKDLSEEELRHLLERLAEIERGEWIVERIDGAMVVRRP